MSQHSCSLSYLTKLVKPFLLFSLLSLLAGNVLAKELAYVTNEKDNSISVVDLDDFSVIKEIPVGD